MTPITELFAPAEADLINDGTAEGQIFVTNTRLFRVGATAILTSDTQPDVFVLIIEIQDDTAMIVQIASPTLGTSFAGSDVSMYLVADSAHLNMFEQLGEEVASVELSRQTNVLKSNIFPTNPTAFKFLPVRLTDGTDFYVAGGSEGGGGGPAETQVRNSANLAWVNIGTGAESLTVLHMPVRFQGTGADVVEPLDSDPIGTEFAIPVRNINNGIQIVDNSGVTQPISAVSLPLPTGAATEATLQTRLTDNTFTNRINTLGQKAMDFSTPVVIASNQSAVSVTGTITGTVAVSNLPATQPVSVVSLPLPTGAATEATLLNTLTTSAFQARINTLGQKAMTASTPVVLSSDQSAIPVTDNGGTLTVDGTITANIGTSGSLALDATLTGGTQKTKLVDSGGVNVAVVSAAGALKTDSSATTQPVSGTFFQATQPVSATSLPLPTGAATEATLAKLTIPLGTALDANTQTMVGGSVTTNPPTYTNGQISPLSLTATGNVRVINHEVGTATNGTETVVTNVATQILAANANRKYAMIQNSGGDSNIRIGFSGISATTGIIELKKEQFFIFTGPFVPTVAIFAIRIGGGSAAALASEIT